MDQAGASCWRFQPNNNLSKALVSGVIWPGQVDHACLHCCSSGGRWETDERQGHLLGSRQPSTPSTPGWFTKAVEIQLTLETPGWVLENTTDSILSPQSGKWEGRLHVKSILTPSNLPLPSYVCLFACLFCFFKQGFSIIALVLWNLICRPGRSWAHRYPPVSAPQGLGLTVCAPP